MNEPCEDFQKIESGLSSLKGKDYISEPTVNFFRNITKAQHSIKIQLLKEETPYPLTDNDIKVKMENSIPMITWDKLSLNDAYLRDLFQAICGIMKNHEESESGSIQKLIDAEHHGNLKLKNLVEKLFQHDSSYFQSLSKDLEVSEDILVFVSLNLAKPFFEVIAEQIKDQIADKVMMDTVWLKNYCPVCGSSAHLAKLEKDAGKKILYCSLCGTEWRFMRIKCPFCCTEEQKNMKFLAQEKSPYRIDVCKKCKRYIKTLDERKGGDEKRTFIPSVEDLATMYLDILAEKEGYTRSWFFPSPVEDVKAGGESKTLH